MTKIYDEIEINEIVNAQKKFFMCVRPMTYEYRIKQLKALKNSILKYQDELEKALKIDLNKSAFESYSSEIGFVLNSISHMIKHLAKWMKPTKCKTPISLFYSQSMIIKEAYGVVYIIGPYNYPFQLLFEPLIGAIAAGNCAILSPSELTLNVAEVIKKIIGETFAQEYICCVDGGIENNTLLLNAKLDYVFFTGSVNVGKIVMQTCAKQLIPVTLELGGKSPVIIDETVNLAVAAKRIVWGKLMNAGQTCVAPDYICVDNKVKSALLNELVDTIKQFYGNDIQASVDLGRIVNDRHIQRLKKIIVEDQRYIYFGGKIDETERYIEPTILSLNNFDAACMQEELFGPILPIIGYDDVKEVLNYINANPKPLALYVFSENKTFIDMIISNTSSGGVAINDTISHIINPNLPFGGIQNSGMGNYHGEASFKTFSHQRSILKRTSKIDLNLIYPPYTKDKLAKIKMFLK